MVEMITRQRSEDTVSSGNKQVGLKDVRRYQSHVHECLASEDANLSLSGRESLHFFLPDHKSRVLIGRECWELKAVNIFIRPVPLWTP